MDDINSRAAEAADALEKAADAFESGTLKWIQGSLGRASAGTACARGAMFYALTGNQCNGQLGHVAARAEGAMGFGPQLASFPGSLPYWNDQQGRTVQDVIDRMKDGAKRLRNGETD